MGSEIATRPPEGAATPGPTAFGAGALYGIADLATGTLTFAPLPSSARGFSSMRPRIYGDQHITVQLYNSTVVIDSLSTPGKKLFSADVGIKNLQNFAIGDEQGSAVPPDTMGIYVFFASEPIVLAPASCTGCTVTVKNHHGTLGFDDLSQKYFHWPERVAAYGAVTGDTTRARMQWTFEASSQVTAFEFYVLLSAAWAAPNDTRWKIEYSGDSLPDTESEPRWRTRLEGGGGTWSASDGALTITANASSNVRFYRRDSISASGSAYVEARLVNNGTSSTPELRLIMTDGSKYIALGIARNTVGFIDSNGAFITGGTYSISTTTYRTYQVRKYAADSAVFLVDGVRQGKLLYSQLSAEPASTQLLCPLVQFGTRSSSSGNASSWDYVLYELGAATP